VDEFSAAHLVVLKHISGASVAIIRNSDDGKARFGNVYHLMLPEFVSRREWLDLLITDLVGASSIDGTTKPGNMTRHGMFLGRVTQLGVQFLEFISDSSEAAGSSS
jgi:hypothetical protein